MVFGQSSSAPQVPTLAAFLTHVGLGGRKDHSQWRQAKAWSQAETGKSWAAAEAGKEKALNQRVGFSVSQEPRFARRTLRSGRPTNITDSQ
jgi:hypothetical protein